MSNLTSLEDRITRLETRLVRGFNELGIDVTHTVSRPRFSKEEGKLVLDSLDTSVASLFKIMVDNGLRPGYADITVEYDGNILFKL